MKTAKTFLNKLYGGDMKSLVLNFAKNEELNNKEIEELRDILNVINKTNLIRVKHSLHMYYV
ncbi:BlaI/MecI/CopY family transcriptional regulator, partial [Staphylococcus aureus]|uniref:BlaI/MecI/CopY family transcriptional regulator n=1 Tax=Staphylococcus aureus TaxID=1280 RepID=UPI0015F2A2AB